MKQTLTLFFCSFISLVHAQKAQFEGLKRTKASYLLKFMDWDKHVPTDSLSIANGLQRIRNTRFFNEVDSRLEVKNGDTIVVFKCQEIFTVLPIVEGGASEGNKWIRLGVEDENGLGKGIRTIAFYQYNDRHSYLLKQFYPLLYKKWGLNYLLKNWSILEPIAINDVPMVYNYINWDAEFLVQYSFDINRHNVEAGIGYMNEIFELPVGDDMHKMQEMENYKRYLVKANHYLNFEDHNTIYVKGWSSKTYLLGSYFLDSKTVFSSFLNESKYFKRLSKKGNLAFRSRIGISSNVNTYLAPFVLDNYYNIRGIGNRIERGTASVTLNAEYRQTVWENRSFAIQIVGFTDMGAIRPSGDRLSALAVSENIKVFSGMGSRFIYKKAYDCDLRIDYGMGIHGGGRGFVLGLGQYF
jgi:outer membrane protein assembly factor BamA